MAMPQLIDVLLNLDTYLSTIIDKFGMGTYLILFVIIFCETGLIVIPFLPGDSLLFAAGALSAITQLNPVVLFVLLASAAILGDNVNYFIGHRLGRRVFTKENSLFFNKKYLNDAEEFYKEHGNKAVLFARFFPIIRTFAPFVAGMGKMDYFKFLFYSIIGGISWVGLFIFSGYFFGNIPFIKENFAFFVMGIIVISLIPFSMQIIKSFSKKKKN